MHCLLSEYLPIELFLDYVIKCKCTINSYPNDKTITIADFNVGDILRSNDKRHINSCN